MQYAAISNRQAAASLFHIGKSGSGYLHVRANSRIDPQRTLASNPASLDGWSGVDNKFRRDCETDILRTPAMDIV